MDENIVFLNLIDASAVNTLIECVVINKLPAIVEILGDSYPLFYNNLEEITGLVTLKNIEKAHIYIRKLDKTNLKIETFIRCKNSQKSQISSSYYLRTLQRSCTILLDIFYAYIS